jgi:hypothetical protein
VLYESRKQLESAGVSDDDCQQELLVGVMQTEIVVQEVVEYASERSRAQA